MPKTIKLEIDEDTLNSVEAFLAVQVESTRDDITGAQTLRRVKGRENVDAFITDVVNQALHQIVMQHPTGVVRQKMEERKRLEDEIKNLAAARPIGGAA